MRYRSVLGRILLLLALGFLINALVVVVVASSVNIHTGRRSGGAGPAGTLHREVSVRTAFGSQRVTSKYESANLGITNTTPDDLAPKWAPLSGPPRSDVTAYFEGFEARGWPALSFWCRSHRVLMSESVQSQPSQLTGGVELPMPASVSLSGRKWPRLLPYRPIWSGLVANALVYAACLYFLFLGPSHFRQFFRRRRSQCPWCGYPCGASSVCSECGRAPSNRPVA